MKITDHKVLTEFFPAKVQFFRIDPEDIAATLSDILRTLMDLSWLSKFDQDFEQKAFTFRAKKTIDDIKENLELVRQFITSGDYARAGGMLDRLSECAIQGQDICCDIVSSLEFKEVTKSKKEKDHKELEKVVELNISEVEPTLNQPRKVFDKEKLEELANSIKENGVLQPILVVKDENGYTIVAGERRWRAAKIAGLKVIPAIIKDYTDSRKKQVALIENIQREDLNVVEIAKAIKELMDIDGYTHSDVAKVTGKNVSTISNLTRLLKLPDEILNYVLQGKMVEGHARALLAVEDKEKQ